jgi:anti-sigma B factor antagonist
VEFAVDSQRVENEVYLVTLSGEVDLYTAPELKKELLEAIDDGARTVVLDMTKTTFIDSTTLGVLVGGVKRLRELGGELSLVCRDHNIIKIFEITGLDRVFSIHEERESALAAAHSGEASPS